MEGVDIQLPHSLVRLIDFIQIKLFLVLVAISPLSTSHFNEAQVSPLCLCRMHSSWGVQVSPPQCRMHYTASQVSPTCPPGPTCLALLLRITRSRSDFRCWGQDSAFWQGHLTDMRACLVAKYQNLPMFISFYILGDISSTPPYV